MSIERRYKRWYVYLSFRSGSGRAHLYVGRSREEFELARDYKRLELERRQLGQAKRAVTMSARRAAGYYDSDNRTDAN